MASTHALEKRYGSQPARSQLIVAGFLFLKKQILRGERRPPATFSPPQAPERGKFLLDRECQLGAFRLYNLFLVFA